MVCDSPVEFEQLEAISSIDLPLFSELWFFTFHFLVQKLEVGLRTHRFEGVNGLGSRFNVSLVSVVGPSHS